MPDKPSIPDYYRHLADPKADEPDASKHQAPEPSTPESPSPPPAPPAASPPPVQPTSATPPVPVAPAPPTSSFQAHAFSLDVALGAWEDKSVYILAGPVSDGLQHNVTVTLDPEVPDGLTLDAYADLQIAALEGELRGCHILLHDGLTLDCGLPARRVVFRWEPSDAVRVYQEQLYVLDGGMGYKLTATFTRKTRKTLGPKVERIMKSFTPKPIVPATSEAHG